MAKPNKNSTLEMLLKKEHVNQNFIWSILIAFMSLLTSCTFGFDESGYIGVYQVDLSKSQMGSYTKQSSNYDALELHIARDGTFNFNVEVPFFASQKGTWEIRDIDGFGFLYLQYGKGDYAVIEDQVNRDAAGNIYILNTRPRQNMPNVKKIVFARIAESY